MKDVPQSRTNHFALLRLAQCADALTVTSPMKRLFILLLPAMLMASGAIAQVTTAEADRALYLEYLEKNTQAGICAGRLPDFAEKYPPLLRKWKVRYESVLRLGDAFIRSEAVRDQISVEEKIEKAIRTSVSKLEAAGEAETQKTCGDVQRWFEQREEKSEAKGA